MRNLAIIPARGGSKRIHKKNIKEFLGKPIIAYSIEIALKSGLFDEVMVSTDDANIAEVARKYGAKVPFFRSKKSSDDYATLADVIDEVKANYVSQGQEFDSICCILPTSPLMTEDNLNKAYDLLCSDQEIDSVKPVLRFSYPIQRALKMENNRVEMFHPEHQTTRSQDLEEAYHDAGQFYWMKFKTGLRGKYKLGLEIAEMEAQDIDNHDDWEIAELKFKLFYKIE